MLRTPILLPLLAQMRKSGHTMPLAAAAAVAGMSPTHLQRIFAARVKESPAKYQQRLRLERGAASLRSSDARIIDIAFTAGFESHQAFTRAFTAHFGVSPKTYRNRSNPLTNTSAQLVAESGPCVGLYRIELTTNRKERPMPTSEIKRESIDETPTVVARRRVDKDQLAEALAECLPAAYGYVMQAGLTMAGPPFVRYLSQSAAFFDIEAGVPLVEPAGEVTADDLFAGTLPGGEAAVAIHHGSYESLGDTHLALDRWIDNNELTATGGPWEIYLTDPGEVPDPNEWQTMIVSPIA